MPYKVSKTPLEDVLLLMPEVYEDDRGFFMESFNERLFDNATGLNIRFVQDNFSRSKKGVLRGIHYQVKKPQGKLVRVSYGEVFDVAVDLRTSSKNYGKWAGFNLSSSNNNQLWIPPGFGHGFFVLSDYADFQYKTTEYYFQEYERTIKWNDTDLKIDWQTSVIKPILNSKDINGSNFKDAEVFK